MPSLLPIPNPPIPRLWRIALTLSMLCWVAACQQSSAPDASPKPAPPAAAPQPAPQPFPPPTGAETPPLLPQASIDPPRYQYQQQQQQHASIEPHPPSWLPPAAVPASPHPLPQVKPPVLSGKPPPGNNGSIGTYGSGSGYGSGGWASPPRPKFQAKPANPTSFPAPAHATGNEPPPAATASPAPSSTSPPPEIARFDWPPPKASAQEAIPDKWLRTGTVPTLADVADKFEKAMKLAAYQQRSYYSVPRGFALAAQFEHIQADGTPLPGEDRWRVGTPRVGNLSLLAFIQALAHAPAGIYRAIVFVVTDAPWAQSPTAPSDEQIMAWAGAGAASLPASIGNLPYGPNYRAHALIYEFRKGSSGPAETVMPSEVSGEIHLEKGGLWNPLSIL